ncbi:MAG: AMP-binding protein [Rubrivivax sp.]
MLVTERRCQGAEPAEKRMSVEWNYALIWEAIAEAVPDRPALIQGERVHTWRRFEREADALARFLVGAGIGRGAKVAVYLFNGVEYLTAYFAAFKAGLAPLNINYRYVASELAYVLDDADAEVCIFDAEFLPNVEGVRARLPRVKLWIQVGERASGAQAANVLHWNEWVAGSAQGLFRAPWGISPDDLVLIYTGGTTGAPKGVMWRQHDLIGARDFGASPLLGLGPLTSPAHAGQRAAASQMRTALIASPLMHGTGFLSALSAMMGGGATAYLPSRRFDAVEAWSEAERLGASRMTIVGDTFCRPLVEALERSPDRWDLSALRVVFSSGTMWSAEVKAALLAKLPKLKLLDTLGSSEAAGMGSSLSSGEAPAQTARFRMGPHCAVFDEQGRRVPPGSSEAGVLAVGGYIPLGYYKDAAKTEASFPVWEGQRWSCPGDLASVAADGTIQLLGRGNQCINTGGEKVYPEEVEEALKQYPGVRDAAVLGIAEPRLGQQVCAVIEVDDPAAAPSLRELTDALRGGLAGYKLPRSLLAVTSLQRTPAAKLRYDLLREWVHDARVDGRAPVWQEL